MLEHLTDESFKKKVFDYESCKEWKFNGDLPCLVDFYTDWCGPCKMVAPTLESLAEEFNGKVNIYKVNTDQEARLAGAFGINTIPSLLFIPKEGQPQMAVGAMSRKNFEEAFEEILKVKKEV